MTLQQKQRENMTLAEWVRWVIVNGHVEVSTDEWIEKHTAIADALEAAVRVLRMACKRFDNTGDADRAHIIEAVIAKIEGR